MFYTEEWLEYMETNKPYLVSVLKENDEFEPYRKDGNPIIKLVAQNIVEVRTEAIMDVARERGSEKRQNRFPMHLAWEMFQSSRSIIWNAIKTFYIESNEKFSMERVTLFFERL